MQSNVHLDDSSAIYKDLKVSDSWWHIVILLLPMPSLKYASLFLAEGFEWPDNYFSDTDTIDVNEDTEDTKHNFSENVELSYTMALGSPFHLCGGMFCLIGRRQAMHGIEMTYMEFTSRRRHI